MRKVKINKEDTMYSTDEFYSPRVADLDKQLIKLLWLLAIVMIVVSILN
jgi:type IV secretory pathway component VirB8